MRNILFLFVMFLLIGVVLTILAFLGWFTPLSLLVSFTLISSLFVYCVVILFLKLPMLSKYERIFVYFFTCVWALHFLQVLVPETGFDALWYHLPVSQQVLQVGGLVYLPQLYQSVNPQFADLYFLTGFSVLGLLGAKLIAYLFASFLAIATYCLARLFSPRKFAIAVTVLVSTFQVVSWQSASFYIDVAKAFFEVAGLLFLFYSTGIGNSFLEKNFYKKTGLLFFSASLATKLFSLLLVPVFIFAFGVRNFFNKNFYMYLLLLFSVPLLYYWFAYAHIGNPFYSLFIHTEKLQEIGGQANPIIYALTKVSTLPKSLLAFMMARDYVNPVLVLFFIPIFLKIKTIWLDTKLRVLFFFSVSQWCVWWFVPPISTRYALSGFITLLILGVSIVVREFAHTKNRQNTCLLILFFLAVLAVVPRVFVAQRSLKYILTNQTRQNYLQQFYDGSIDEKINGWYGYSGKY